MIFSQSLPTDEALNAHNENIVKFREAVGDDVDHATVYAEVIGIGFLEFKVNGITSGSYMYFEFNFKEVFKYFIGQNLYADDFDYVGIDTDNEGYKYVNTLIRTIDSTGATIADNIANYLVLNSVKQIEDEERWNSIKPILHHNVGANSYDDVILDVFPGYPFDISVFRADPEGLQNFWIENDPFDFGDDITTTISGNRGLYRIPIINKDGDLVEYDPGQEIILSEQWLNLVKVFYSFSEDYWGIYLRKNTTCGTTYLKWKNSYGGWDYWLFSDKHQVQEADKLTGVLNTSWDNIENVYSLESSLGKEGSIIKTIGADFLDAYQFKRVSKIIYSPKVYLWTGTKFIEVFISGKNKFVANNAAGQIEFSLAMPKRLTQKI